MDGAASCPKVRTEKASGYREKLPCEKAIDRYMQKTVIICLSVHSSQQNDSIVSGKTVYLSGQ